MSSKRSFPHVCAGCATPFASSSTAENALSASDFIYPMPYSRVRGNEKPSSMPGVERLSIDLLTERAREAFELGIPAIALPPEKPRNRWMASLPPDGLLSAQ